jgi:hypothetical protein
MGKTNILLLCVLLIYLLGLLLHLLGLWPSSRFFLPITSSCGDVSVDHTPRSVERPSSPPVVESYGAPMTHTAVVNALQLSEIRGSSKKAGRRVRLAEPGMTDKTPPTIDERYKDAKKTLPEDRLSKGILTHKERLDHLNTMVRRPQTSAKRRQWRDEFRDYFRGDPVPAHKNDWNINRNRNDHEDSLPGALSCNNSNSTRWNSESTPVGGTNEPEDDDYYRVMMNE